MTSLFASFVGLFSGDLIFKGISPLKGKENTKIFSDKITIIDNPRNLEALTIANYDDEGCPTKEKVLVDKGVFSSMLHDTKVLFECMLKVQEMALNLVMLRMLGFLQ